MGKERVAVVGIGQTHHQATRGDVTIAGLVREAAQRALDDAEMTWSDIEAVVVGKAPDFFEGVMMPELYLAEALGAVGKPLLRVHTAGSVGGSTALVAASLVAARIHRRVLTVAFEKQSESEAMWALALPIPFQQPLVAGAGGFFAPHIRAYMRRSGAPDEIGILVALKDRRNALKNPDGACAMVLTDEAGGDAAPTPPAWMLGGAMRSEPTLLAGRDQVSPLGGRECAADVYRQAGITDPRREIDMAEIYVPFSWYEPMWLENLGFAEEGAGWKLVEEGATQLDGDLPVNASGGVLSSNPIGASGMIRFAEAALQVRGMAGEHQVPGARVALGHAYGGGSQFFAMWAVGARKPGS
jgi:acetyl-CoA C-acetyltransferase